MNKMNCFGDNSPQCNYSDWKKECTLDLSKEQRRNVFKAIDIVEEYKQELLIFEELRELKETLDTFISSPSHSTADRLGEILCKCSGILKSNYLEYIGNNSMLGCVEALNVVNTLISNCKDIREVYPKALSSDYTGSETKLAFINNNKKTIKKLEAAITGNLTYLVGYNIASKFSHEESVLDL